MSWKSKTALKKKKNQILGKFFESDKKEGDETINEDDKKTTLKKHNK